MNSSNSAEHARAANRASMAMNKDQTDLTEQSRLVLVGMIRDEMSVAVAKGIQDAMTEEAAERFWLMGLKVAQRQAAQKTGVLVGGALMALVRKGLVFTLLGGIVYAVGGWAALAGLMKLVAGSKS